MDFAETWQTSSYCYTVGMNLNTPPPLWNFTGLKKGVDIEREDAFFLILYGKIESTRKVTFPNSTLTRGVKGGGEGYVE